MAKLVKYGLLSTNKNTIDHGYLIKAMCEFCGKKFNSVEEAKKCEVKHIDNCIKGVIK